jgi:16S rRNA (guanine527-N7)-methyltransferase
VTSPAFPLPPGRVPAPPEAAAEVFAGRVGQAIRYAELLGTWGVERGLIGPREPARIWDRHLLNSAALAGGVREGADVLDVGSGAGLPGIPLALARPDLRIRLVEPMQRRADFLREVLATLRLEMEVVCARAEDLPSELTDVVVARAVAPLERLLPWTLPLLKRDGTLLALKGRSAEAEMTKARPVLLKWPSARWSVGTVTYAGVSAGVARIDLGPDAPQ